MIAAIAVFAIVFAAGAVLLENSSDVDGAVSYIKGDTNVVKTSGSLTYQIMFFESEEFETLDLSYTALLKDSSGATKSGTISPSSGVLSNGIESTLTVTAPAAAGKYTLVVTFTEKKNDDEKVETERTQTITVVEPVVLTAVLRNNSNVDFTNFVVYFKVDGKLVDESRSMVSVAAGDTTTVTHEWVSESYSNGRHTFQVVAGDENIGSTQTSFLGGEGTFYVGHSDYGLVNILLGILAVVLIIVVVYLYRKPVKNYGKPKSRR
ncbi:MAG: hypothetical protein FWG60_03785 [Methanomassiliicoccaceae archaeon]|nr:hypothetical protein [Methanomassiliicoccaceae archaeon]